jgi:hypothetical protein
VSFDPKSHLIQLPRRVKDQNTGQWVTRQDDYLEVKWRLVWFRERFPHGTIESKFFCLDWEKEVAICHATVTDGEGGSADGTGTETRKGFEDFVEKSQTRAIGRALAALGIGTQFVGEELSEGDHVADAPVITSTPPPLLEGESLAPASPNGHPSTHHPTPPKPKPAPARALVAPEAIEELILLACERCGEDREAFATRVKRAMKLKEDATITKRVLCESMSPEAYKSVYAWYETLYAQLQRKTEVPDANRSPEAATPEPAPAPAGETPTAVPSPATASTSAASDPTDATERDRVRLRKEVAQWDLRVPPQEVEHVIQHNPYSKARALLWKCRRQPNTSAEALVAD